MSCSKLATIVLAADYVMRADYARLEPPIQKEPDPREERASEDEAKTGGK